jgi:phosphotriesterase-related protein
MKLKKGYTLMHEHIAIDLSKIKNDGDARLDCFDETVREFKELKAFDVGNILDVTNIGMGRDVEYAQNAARESGINILYSTGFYKEPFLPPEVYDKSADELAKIFLKEIKEGIDKTQVKAVCIGEIGTSKNEMTKMEKKVFEASAVAAKESGAVIYTHTTLGTYALEQIDFLLSRAVNPEKIIIGHIDLSQNLDYIKKVLDRGVYTAFDTVGKNNYFPDEKRVQFLCELEKEKKLNRILLSLDITRKSHLKAFGGLGYTHLFDSFLPALRQKGIQEQSIDQMLIENPKQLLEDK